MNHPDVCPHCKADLTGEPIPQEYLDAGYYAAGSTHYSRKIGVEVSGLYDGILFWQCPDCKGRWHRFGPDHVLHQRAAAFIQGDPVA